MLLDSLKQTFKSCTFQVSKYQRYFIIEGIWHYSASAFHVNMAYKHGEEVMHFFEHDYIPEFMGGMKCSCKILLTQWESRLPREWPVPVLLSCLFKRSPSQQNNLGYKIVLWQGGGGSAAAATWQSLKKKRCKKEEEEEEEEGVIVVVVYV